MKLPIPVLNNGTKISEAEIKSYNAGVIADTQKVAESGDSYRALETFISGCLETLGDLSGSDLRAAVKNMPYKTAEYLSTKIIVADKDDAVEGVYECPRCGNQITTENDPEHFTADRISDLDVTYTEDTFFSIGLKKPVKLPVTDEPIAEVQTIEMDYPTLNQCSLALNKVGRGDKIRLQIAIYVEALRKVNAIEVDKKWKSRWGMILFERMSDDLRAIGDKANAYGLQTELEKNCLKCGKKFKTNITTSNFFASALA